MTLTCNYGMELTFHGRLGSPRSKQVILDRLQGFAVQHGLRAGNPRVYQDSNSTVEFNSPVLRTLQQVEDFYLLVRRIAKARNWPIHHPRWTSGGGHLHVSRKRGANNALGIAEAVFPRQQFLSWAFNDIEDFDVVLRRHNYGFNEKTGITECVMNTVELRFFRAPHCLREQLLHVRFADAWLGYLLQQGQQGHSRDLPSTPRPRNFRAARTSFLGTIEAIGLAPREYELFVRNLKAKFDYGYRFN